MHENDKEALFKIALIPVCLLIAWGVISCREATYSDGVKGKVERTVDVIGDLINIIKF